MGDVLEFPTPKGVLPEPEVEVTVVKSCFNCYFHTAGPRGFWCTAFGEEIFNEIKEAEECNVFENVG